MSAKSSPFSRRVVDALRILASLVAVLVAGDGAASEMTAVAVIERAIEAHGGPALTDTNSLVLEWRVTDSLIRQSRRPGPPWDRTERWQASAIDFAGQRYAGATYDGGSGYEWLTGTQVLADGARRINYRSAAHWGSAVTFDGAIGDAIRFSPVALLRWVREHPERATYRGIRRVADTQTQRLDVSSGDGGAFEAHFDAETGELRALIDGYRDYAGDRIALEYRYSDWRDSGGLRYPARVDVRIGGEPGRRAELLWMERDRSIERHLEVPQGFTEAPAIDRALREFRVEKLADGVYFVGGDAMYTLAVEFDEYLVALDGSSGDVKRRIAAIRELVPSKPVRYVLASHHHDDHLQGLDEFAALGATILTAPAHADVVDRYVRQQLGRPADLRVVGGEVVIEDADRTLAILALDATPHSEQGLAGYLHDAKLLFAADLFVLGSRRRPVVPAMQNGVALHAFIEGRALDVDRIVDPHSALVASIEDLERAVDRAKQSDVLADACAALGAWRSIDREVCSPDKVARRSIGATQ